MKAVVQRVAEASVEIEGVLRARIGPGLLVLLGVARGDTEEQAVALADKIAQLRICDDPEGRMNRSVADVRGEVLVVSQFTLCADCERGRRPGFDDAAPPQTAERLYVLFVRYLETAGLSVLTGVFGARMRVALVNDGPVTIVLEKK
jgi:D-tyrosyl-tRNA(Tyr) deacylase